MGNVSYTLLEIIENQKDILKKHKKFYNKLLDKIEKSNNEYFIDNEYEPDEEIELFYEIMEYQKIDTKLETNETYLEYILEPNCPFLIVFGEFNYKGNNELLHPVYCFGFEPVKDIYELMSAKKKWIIGEEAMDYFYLREFENITHRP